MDQDRAWVNYKGISDRRDPEYVDVVNGSLEFAFYGKEEGTETRGLCVDCILSLFYRRRTIHRPLKVQAVVRNYSPWAHHGESDYQLYTNVDNTEEE